MKKAKKKLNDKERVMAGLDYDDRPMYYKRNGKPYMGPDAVLEWAKDHQVFANRVVKQEKLWWGAWLSTVWLGLDHSFMMEDRPLIFESMLFAQIPHATNFFGRDALRWFEEEITMDRYSTEAEALDGHDLIKAEYSSLVVAFPLYFKHLWNSIYLSLQTLIPILVRNVLTALLPPKLSVRIQNLLHVTRKPPFWERLKRSENSPSTGDTKTNEKTLTT